MMTIISTCKTLKLAGDMFMKSSLQIIRQTYIQHRFIFIGKDINKITMIFHINVSIILFLFKVKHFADYFILESGWRAAPAILIPPPLARARLSSRSEARDLPATSTALLDAPAAAKQGICQLLALPFIKKVFAVYFRQIPCGAAGRDLPATSTALLETPAAGKKGIHQLLPLPFIKKVFAVYFRQIPCGAVGRDLPATSTALLDAPAVAKKGTHWLLPLQFLNKVFTAQFKWIPSRRKARDLTATSTAL